MPSASEPTAAGPVLTIGHSRHPIDAFLAVVRRHGAEVVVDVRSQPASRFSPQFTRGPLERAVHGAAMRYLFLGDALGGRPASPACYGADGKVDYDLVEQQAFYQAGIARLVAGIARYRVCLMCAEENPSHCHRRRLIARTLVGRGVTVHHIRGTGAIETEDELRAARPAAQLSLLPS
jgi:uncharacterized protein (DUF488 family)